MKKITLPTHILTMTISRRWAYGFLLSFLYIFLHFSHFLL